MSRSHSAIEKKSRGIHYTPRELAQRIAARMIAHVPDRSRVLTLLDPAAGDGGLLAELAKAAITDGLTVQVKGFDTDTGAVVVATRRLQEVLPPESVQVAAEDYLDRVEVPGARTLFSLPAATGGADLVIANPPYVRTQVLGAERVQGLAKKFNLQGRIDIYQAFIKAIAWTIAPGGIAGLIVPNRFMSVRAGENIRAFLSENFDILEVWDLGDTRLFEAAVLPCVLILRRNDAPTASAETAFRSVYRAAVVTDAAARAVHDLWGALDEPGLARTASGETLLVRHGKLAPRMDSSALWKISTEASENWLERVTEHTHCRFRDVGKIRVGVKTTADNVFLRTVWDVAERPELLRPVTTHHVARSYHAQAISREILYPHTVKDGKRTTVDLSDFPVAKRYLEKHREQLEGRSYLVGANREWYELWVPQSPELWQLPKVVFRDISESPTFWMDLDGTVVNGDCYWMIDESGKPEMLWLLLAVANSSFIEEFYDYSFNNKLYAGRRRFMTQYVESFPLPDPELASSKELIKLAKRVYKRMAAGDCAAEERARLNELVYASFGLTSEAASGSSANRAAASGSTRSPRSA